MTYRSSECINYNQPQDFLSSYQQQMLVFDIFYAMSFVTTQTLPALGGNAWSMTSIDIPTASAFLNTCTGHGPKEILVKNTKSPQGWIGLRKGEDIRIVCHYIEKKIGIASIVSISEKGNDTEARTKMLEILKNSQIYELDSDMQKSQPSWSLDMLLG